MPELPEVQTIVDGLNSKIVNKTISAIIEKKMGTIIWKENLNICEFGKILNVSRRGKFIIIETSKKLKIIIHLRMTGKLIYEEDISKTSSHSRTEFIFSDNTKMIFDCVRTFGKIWILRKDYRFAPIEKLGVEPLDKLFNDPYLKKQIQHKKIPIKKLILEQQIIAGLGNIYACEILFRAKIHPEKLGIEVTNKETELLVKETKSVLIQALEKNGTTISDYRNVDNKTGEFQNFLKVYQKEFCECGNKISRIKQSGRSTFFCGKCQK